MNKHITIVTGNLQLLLLLIFFLLSAGTHAQVPPWEVPAYEYYVEEPIIETLYVHDTVYISDADKFLKNYFQGPVNVNELAKNQHLLESSLKHLEKVSGEQLFYNFFERQRIPKSLANNLVVREFKLNPDFTMSDAGAFAVPEGNNRLSRELLFRFEGPDRTDRFLNDQEAVVRAISYIFTQLQQDSTITSIDLYFPDFTFKEKRAMAQFVKSIRLVMNASKDYTIDKMKLKIFLRKTMNKEDAGEDFLYSLMLRSSEVVLLQNTDIMDNFYVFGDAMTRDEVAEIGYFTRMKSHFYLARFSSRDVEIDGRNITDFSVKSIREIALADFPENNWEPYLWALIGIVIFIVLFVVLYFSYPPFSYMLNQNLGIVLISSIVIVIEMLTLINMVFQNMCYEDQSTSINENPSLLLCMPVLLVVVLPLLRQFSRNRRLP